MEDFKRSSVAHEKRQKEIQDEIIELYNKQSEIDIHLARMQAASQLWDRLNWAEYWDEKEKVKNKS